MRKVLLVWTLLFVLFLVFNVLYWPTHYYQELSHPASFLSYAQHLADREEPEEARQVLIEGIARLNPPSPRPYEMLAEIETELSNPQMARRMSIHSDFFHALQADPVDKEMLVKTAQVFARTYEGISLQHHAATLLQRVSASFESAFDLQHTLVPLQAPAQLAIFDLAGGAFSFDGAIGNTGAQAPVPLLVYSGGGMDRRRNAHLFVGDIDYADRQRGIHAVLLDESTGAVLQTAVFDLWESVDEARRMLRFLTEAPTGSIGLFAVRDDGSAYMTTALEQALLDFGFARKTVVGRLPAIVGLRYSFAGIGVKGAAPGTAMQAWAPEEFKGYRGHPVVCAVFNRETPS